MYPLQMRLGIILAGTLIVGCAAAPTERMTTGGQPPAAYVGQREAADRAFEYHQRSTALRRAAEQLRLEAGTVAHGTDDTQEQRQRLLERADAMSQAADETERLADDYARQVPHGQLL